MMAVALLKRWSTKVIFTGAGGQVGSQLLREAQEQYGDDNVLATDLKDPSSYWKPTTLFERLDVCDVDQVNSLFDSFKPKSSIT